MGVEYNPGIVTSNLVMYLDAGNQRSYDSTENLLTYSEDFGNTAWTKYYTFANTDVTLAPDGTISADKLIEDTTDLSIATTGHRFIYQPGFSVIANTSYTFSVYIKGAERTTCRYLITGVGGTGRADVNLNTGITSNQVGDSVWTHPTTTSANIGGGWYRVSLTSIPNVGGAGVSVHIIAANTTGTYIYTGDGVSGLYLWGAQLESGPTVSKYTKVTSSSKSRGNTVTDISGTTTTISSNNVLFTPNNYGSFIFSNASNSIINAGTYSKADITQTTLSVWIYPINPISFGQCAGSLSL